MKAIFVGNSNVGMKDNGNECRSCVKRLEIKGDFGKILNVGFGKFFSFTLPKLRNVVNLSKNTFTQPAGEIK